jgi:Fungal Zn(2)-Cys(6) binuclear cluster domain
MSSRTSVCSTVFQSCHIPNKRAMSHITRPRPSLSCAICRRRKVRCGKEQPKCGNCKRMNESCVYESDVYNSQSKSAAKGFNKAESGSDRRKTPAPQNNNWTSSSESIEKSTSLQASSTESNASLSDHSKQSRKNISLSTDSSAFGPKLYSNGQASTGPSAADVPVPFFEQSESNGPGNNAADMPRWDTGDEDVSGLAVGHPMVAENPRAGLPPQTRDGQASSTARKRQRAVFDASTYQNHARPYGQLQSNEAPESHLSRIDLRQQTQTIGSKGDEEAGDEEENIQLPQYLYARNKVNRHVESTFWALISGHVSLPTSTKIVLLLKKLH